MRRLRNIGALAVGAALLLAGLPAAAEDFYKGKQIRIIVGSDAGGGYDAWARLMARYWPDYIPGAPSFIVQNMPGASSLTAINYVANSVPKDGTVIAAVQNQMGYEPLLDLSGSKNGIQFDALKMNWIGSTSKEVAIIAVNSSSPVKTLKDAMEQELVTGSSGVATSNTIYPNVLNATAGTKFKVINGYKGQPEVASAMEKGEVQGSAGWFYSSFKSTHGDWLKTGQARLIAQIGIAKHPELADVPLVLDFAKTPEDRQEMELAFASLIMGRPYVAPPDVPADRVKLLRDTFMKTLEDPRLQADAAKQRLEVGAMSGEAIQKMLSEQYQTPKRIVDKVHQLMVAGQN
jgi:tripartite-type tricarboxylate transporter receptor subunit TctC